MKYMLLNILLVRKLYLIYVILRSNRHWILWTEEQKCTTAVYAFAPVVFFRHGDRWTSTHFTVHNRIRKWQTFHYLPTAPRDLLYSLFRKEVRWSRFDKTGTHNLIKYRLNMGHRSKHYTFTQEPHTKPYWSTSNLQTIPWMFNPCSEVLQPIERSKPALPPSKSIDNYRSFRASCGVDNHMVSEW
jgi:hypothetical protein